MSALAHQPSGIAIGEVQWHLKEAPIDPIEPPVSSGTYEVDENVIAGKYADVPSMTIYIMTSA